APSGGNRQPWHFIVVRDPEVKAAIRDHYLRSWRAYKDMVAEQAKTLPEAAAAIERWKANPFSDNFAENLDKIPVFIIPCLDMRVLSFSGGEESPSVMQMNSVYASIYPAVQNILLTARERGLGAVLTTLHSRYEEEVKQVLGVPAYVRTTSLIPIGHPAARYGPTRRLPAAERTHLDGWDRSLASYYETGASALLVADRMTRNPRTCSPDSLVRDVQALMQEGGFRRVPVVEEGRLVGIVTDRDIRSILLPPDVPDQMKERFDLLRVRRVEEVMTADPVHVTPDTLLEEAADIILRNRIGGLSVVDSGWLVGVVTKGDILSGLLEATGMSRDNLQFSFAVSRRQGEPGLAHLLSDLENAGAEVLSVTSHPEKNDPESKVRYSVRIWIADPGEITPLLKKRGISLSDLHLE
ncbi:MAG: CBS domain-containing protein, partial [bacterium]